ncbi:MAG TPA: hypothetical protein DCQ93_01515 [Bacteroidetes bacterium]|nr:hypothetical protein [Bacteroidota bacterium]
MTIRDKKNNYAVYVKGKYSKEFDNSIPDSISQGGVYHIGLSKVSGKFRFDLSENGITPYYNPNDLGINFQTNIMEHFAGIQWVDNTQHGHILNWSFFEGNDVSMRYSNGAFYDYNINLGGDLTTDKFWTFSLFGNSKPFWFYDYYESRVEGKKFLHAPYVYTNFSIKTDYRKPFMMEVSFDWAESPQPKDPLYGYGIGPSWQATDWLNLGLAINYTFDHSNWGFADYIDSTDQVIIGRRDTKTISNDFYTTILFSPQMNLVVHARHYWSEVRYLEYYNLLNDGNVASTSLYTTSHDENFNAWNVDVVYEWQFAPGSFLNLIWKQSLVKDDASVGNDYATNLRETLQLPADNTLALKLIYYLDYQKVKKVITK